MPSPRAALGASAPDLADVRGQEVARRALEIAAAGGHNLLFVGPPGSGKTMLARRLPGILPPLSFDEALETTMVYSVAGLLRGARAGRRAALSRAPPHGDQRPGWSAAVPRRGRARSRSPTTASCFSTSCSSSRARCWRRCASRWRSGRVTIVRARRSVTYPADFMLVAALNPCPCGHLGSAVRTCTCSLTAIGGYRSRLSGPLLDRIDMHVDVPALPYGSWPRASAG